MTIPFLTFLNHASFAVETEDSVLLIDPWLEGTAFYNGWALLESSISNSDVISMFYKTEKKLFLWYSHEHSDHLSFSFLKDIKSTDNASNVNILYQKTLDGRVAKALRAYGFSVLEQVDGKCFRIGNELSITTWKWGGDSFSIIEAGNITILNLNDCVVNTPKLASILHGNVFR